PRRSGQREKDRDKHPSRHFTRRLTSGLRDLECPSEVQHGVLRREGVARTNGGGRDDVEPAVLDPEESGVPGVVVLVVGLGPVRDSALLSGSGSDGQAGERCSVTWEAFFDAALPRSSTD